MCCDKSFQVIIHLKQWLDFINSPDEHVYAIMTGTIFHNNFYDNAKIIRIIIRNKENENLCLLQWLPI